MPGEYVAPFLRSGPGFATDGYPKFDLDQWNPEYFERLHGFLTAAQERDVIIELTLFSNTYSDAVWGLNPFNIQNNINGVGDIPWQDYISRRDAALFGAPNGLRQQRSWTEVNRYDSFYFEVCNEPFTTRAGMVPRRPNLPPNPKSMPGKRRYASRFSASGGRSPQEAPHLPGAGRKLAHRYARSSRSWGKRRSTPINLHDYQQLTYKDSILAPLSNVSCSATCGWPASSICGRPYMRAGKPFVFDEDNTATSSLDEQSWIVHRKRAWATVCSGGHYNMIDFSIQVGGQEAGTPASQAMIRSWMKNLSAFIHGVDFVRMRPGPDLCHPDAVRTTIAITLVPAGPGLRHLRGRQTGG